MSIDDAAADERIRLAKVYFAKVDAGDGTLLEMFTEDVQAYFPKIGTTRGKAALVTLVQTLGMVVRRFIHEPSHMVFTHQGNRLVVEGVEAGEFTDGWPFPAGGKSEGRFCNVFEFKGRLISRLHIHADPDFAGESAGRFPTSAARRSVAAEAGATDAREMLAAATDIDTTTTEGRTWHADSKGKSPSSPAEPLALVSPQQSASSRKGRGCM